MKIRSYSICGTLKGIGTIGWNMEMINSSQVWSEKTAVLSNKMISLEEKAIRDVLISLGWIPPGDNKVVIPQFFNTWEMK